MIGHPTQCGVSIDVTIVSGKGESDSYTRLIALYVRITHAR